MERGSSTPGLMISSPKKNAAFQPSNVNMIACSTTIHAMKSGMPLGMPGPPRRSAGIWWGRRNAPTTREKKTSAVIAVVRF